MSNRAHLILRTDRPTGERPFILRPPEPGEKERAEALGRRLAQSTLEERQRATDPRSLPRRKCPSCHRQRALESFRQTSHKCNVCREDDRRPRRKCPSCDVTKPLTNFYASPHGVNGYNSECKSCQSRRASLNKRLRRLEKAAQ